MDRPTAAVWIAAILAVVLMLMSFTGHGAMWGGMAMGWMVLWLVLPLGVIAWAFWWRTERKT